MSQTNNIQIFANVPELCEATANFIIEIANAAIAKNGRFIIALSGGSTPNELYKLLATEKFNNKIPWNKTIIFWGDERCVGLDDKQNNAYVARTLLLDKIEIPKTNIHPVEVNFSPAEAAKKYEVALKELFKGQQPKFDLIFLGLGENAHTASLFPGTEVLHETNSWVKDVWVEEQNMFRVTMTAPLINQANAIVFLVTGKQKAAVLKTVFNEPFQPEKYPAQLINPVDGKLYWFVDKEAGQDL